MTKEEEAKFGEYKSSEKREETVLKVPFNDYAFRNALSSMSPDAFGSTSGGEQQLREFIYKYELVKESNRVTCPMDLNPPSDRETCILRLWGQPQNGKSFYVGFRAAQDQAQDSLWTLPTTIGTPYEFLWVDSNNELHWAMPWDTVTVIGKSALGTVANATSFLNNFIAGAYGLVNCEGDSNRNVLINPGNYTMVHIGSDNVHIGYNAGNWGNVSEKCTIVGATAQIEYGTNSIVIGYGASVSGASANNTCKIGNADLLRVQTYGYYETFVADGTIPFVTDSTTLCPNLNADKLDGYDATSIPVGAHQLDSSTYHTVSGLTAGHFLKALTAATFGFAAHGLTYSDVGAAASGHTHAGVYEPVISGGTSAQYWRGDKSFQALNQAAVAGLTIDDSVRFGKIGVGGTPNYFFDLDDITSSDTPNRIIGQFATRNAAGQAKAVHFVISPATPEILFTTGAVGTDPILSFSTAGAAAQLSINTSGYVSIASRFACNGATPQAAYVSGGAITPGAGAFGASSAVNFAAMVTLVQNIRAALVANGIMS